MIDPRDPPGPTYREPAPHAPTAVVRYSMSGPIGVVVAWATPTLFLLLCGWVAVTQWGDPKTSWGGLAISTLVVVSLFAWPVFLTGNVHVEVDYGAGIVFLRRMRWPLRPRVRTFPIARVTDAVIDRERGEEDVRYKVFLLIEGAPAVPLVEGTWGWDPDEKRIDETADAIRALLPRRRSR